MTSLKALWWIIVSELSRQMYLPLYTAMPRLLPHAKPRLSPLTRMRWPSLQRQLQLECPGSQGALSTCTFKIMIESLILRPIARHAGALSASLVCNRCHLRAVRGRAF